VLRIQTSNALEVGELVILSLRERDIVRLVACGLSNKSIAYELGIATSTVKTHIARIMVDLIDVHSRAELTRWAYTYPDALLGVAVPRRPHPRNCSCELPSCRIGRV
jgi:DNA-binding NarL/FixJ family response regulator